MSAARKAGYFLLLLIALCYISWYLASAPTLTQLDEHTLLTTADTVVYALTVRQFDKQGHLLNQLNTPLLRHIPKNNSHLIKDPHIIVSQNNHPTMTIHSQFATALYGGREITFKQDVVIHQAKDDKNPESSLKTEKITYFTKAQLAVTDLPVSWEQAGNCVQAIGMKAFLAEKRVQLLSKARGTYAFTQS